MAKLKTFGEIPNNNSKIRNKTGNTGNSKKDQNINKTSEKTTLADKPAHCYTLDETEEIKRQNYLNRLSRNKTISRITTGEQLLLKRKQKVEKSLIRRYECRNTIHKDFDEIHSQRCESRLCTYCNSIKTKIRIDRYLPIISLFREPQHLVLSLPNITGDQLYDRIKQYNETLRKIFNNETLRRNKTKLVSIRNLEITYNKKTDTYHPHWHMVTENYKTAEYIKNKWIEINRIESDYIEYGCKITKADLNIVKELFKYTLKGYEKPKRPNKEIKPEIIINPEVLNIIEESIKGLRLFADTNIKWFAKQNGISWKEHKENQNTEYIKKKEESKMIKYIPNGKHQWNDKIKDWIKEDKKGEEIRLTNYNIEDNYKITIKKRKQNEGN